MGAVKCVTRGVCYCRCGECKGRKHMTHCWNHFKECHKGCRAVLNLPGTR